MKNLKKQSRKALRKNIKELIRIASQKDAIIQFERERNTFLIKCAENSDSTAIYALEKAKKYKGENKKLKAKLQAINTNQ